jgi:hypothetical protein
VLECLREEGFAVCEVDGAASSPLVIAKKIREWIEGRRSAADQVAS